MGQGKQQEWFACWVPSPVLPLKFKNPGQPTAFSPSARFPLSFHLPVYYPFFTTPVSPLYWLCVARFWWRGYREAEILLQPMEEPMLQQGDARRRL